MRLDSQHKYRKLRPGLFRTVCSTALLAVAVADEPVPLPPQRVAEPVPQQPDSPTCAIDLTKPRELLDILSNVLIRSEGKPEPEVRQYLEFKNLEFNNAQAPKITSETLTVAVAEHFKIDAKRFEASVEHWRHVNCLHGVIPGYVAPDSAHLFTPVPSSDFARDVTLHVVLHELAHAVIREFDLMVLANEETMADAFATHMLTEHFPDQAVRSISARVKSLMIEANEEPRVEWTVHGEHDNDARRAYQIAALAVAADEIKYAEVAKFVGMSEQDVARARDYGADIHRAWRRTLSPLMMPAGSVSKEFRFRADEFTRAFVNTGEPSIASTIESAFKRFDWHSRVSVEFVAGKGRAAWNRSKRTVTVKTEYLLRFVAQGVTAEKPAQLEDPVAR